MRVWVVRGGDQNRLVDDFVTSSAIALVYPQVPNVRTIDRWTIERRLEDSGASMPDVDADLLLAFVHEVLVGDAVLLPDPGRGEVVVGVVEGAYDYRPDVDEDRGQHRRRVTWLGRHATKDLPEAFRDVGRQRPALKRRDSGAFDAHLERVRSGALGRPADHFEKPRAVAASSGGGGAGAPRRRVSRPSTPKAPARAEPAVRTCPSCFQQKPIALFDGDICRDCE